MSEDKFCLKWNDFEANISGAFRQLRDDKDFFDVTLACDDEQINAHKVILSACSPFFRTVLRRNPHPHPLVYMKGVRFSDLQSVLNFMYHGEVNVAQEDLNVFLTVAEELKIKGLTQNSSDDRRKSSSTSKQETVKHRPPSLPKPPPLKLSPPVSVAPAPAPAVVTADVDDDIQEIPPQIKHEPFSVTGSSSGPGAKPQQLEVEYPAHAEDEDYLVGYEEDWTPVDGSYQDTQQGQGSKGEPHLTTYDTF